MTARVVPVGVRLPELGARGEGWVVLQVVLIVLLVAAGFSGPAWSGDLRVAGAVVGAGLILAGIVLMAGGIAWLRRQLTPFPHPVPDGLLITDGPFAVVRHPMYAGGVILAIGWALMAAAPLAFGVAVTILAFLDLKSRREEAWLTDEFSQYAAYARRTPKLIPFVY